VKASFGGTLKPHVLLRAASILALLHALLNTFAGLLSGTSDNQAEVAVLNAMKALRFNAMGSSRTYWDFYFGFGLFLTVSMVLISALLWQIASLAKGEAAVARPFVGSICAAFIAFAIVSGLYFFIAPLVLEIVIAIILGLAFAELPRRQSH
jgi:hypothetical protein